MSNDLLAVHVRHERRLRLSFSNTLAGGAFETSHYTVENLDGRAESPAVVAAMIVSGTPTAVELALSCDLANGALYRVTAVGVPATDLSVTPDGTHERFRFGTAPLKHKVEPALRDRERVLFGVDLIWTGLDYQLEANGDLARVEGKPNVTKALWRSVETPGLPWDPTWGVDAREYVDSPSTVATPLRGALASQIAKDRRVVAVKSTVEIDGAKTFVHLTPTLIGGEKIEPVSVAVPNDA